MKAEQDQTVGVDIPVVSGFDIIEPIGKGGMGRVWKAIQTSTNREVAIKTPSLDGVGTEYEYYMLDRFTREILFASRVQHAYVVPVYHANHEENGEPLYLAQRLVLANDNIPKDACSLLGIHSQFRSNKEFFYRIAELFRDIADAISAVHRAGIIHGDIKLQNLLVGRNGRLHLTDFGLADNAGEKTYEAEGSPIYVAPEQAAGRKCQQSDVYSLGVALAIVLGSIDRDRFSEVLNGIDSVESSVKKSVLLMHLLPTVEFKAEGSGECDVDGEIDPSKLRALPENFDVASFCPDAPVYLKWIILNATRSNPKRRFENPDGEMGKNAERMRYHLDRFLNGEPCPSEPLPLRMLKAAVIQFRKRWLLYLLAFALLTALSLAYLFYSQNLAQKRDKAKAAEFQKQQAFDDDLARRTELYEQALMPLRNGFGSQAKPLLEKALDEYDEHAPLNWKVAYIRSQIGSKSTEESIRELKQLHDSHNSSTDDFAELSFLYADLIASDKVHRDLFNWRRELDNLEVEELPRADQLYVKALTCDDLATCKRHLEDALALRPFHDRASVLYSGLLLILGQSESANEFCDRQLRAKPNQVAFELTKETSRLIVEETSPDLVLSKSFPANTTPEFLEELKSILPAFKSKMPNASGHWSNQIIAIPTQIGVAKNVEEFIEAYAIANPSFGIPVHIFEMRAEQWRELAGKLEKTVKSNFDENSLNDLKEFARKDPDGFGLLIVSMKISFDISKNLQTSEYNERAREIYSEFLKFQTLSSDKQSIVPSEPLRFFNLFMQMSAEFAAIQEAGVNDDELNRNVRHNSKRLVECSRNVPEQMRNEILTVLLTGLNQSMEIENSSVKKSNLSRLALIIIDDWAQQFPDNPKALLFRAYFLEHSNQKKAALEDTKRVLAEDPKDATAIKLRDRLLKSLKSE